MIAYFLTIDIQFIQTGNSNIGTGRFNRFVGCKFLTEIRGCLIIYIFSVANPGSLPILYIHHSCFKRTDRRRYFFIFQIAAYHLPVIFSKRFELFTGISDQHISGVYFSGIPYISFPVDNFHRVFIHQHTI